MSILSSILDILQLIISFQNRQPDYLYDITYRDFVVIIYKGRYCVSVIIARLYWFVEFYTVNKVFQMRLEFRVFSYMNAPPLDRGSRRKTPVLVLTLTTSIQSPCLGLTAAPSGRQRPLLSQSPRPPFPLPSPPSSWPCASLSFIQSPADVFSPVAPSSPAPPSQFRGPSPPPLRRHCAPPGHVFLVGAAPEEPRLPGTARGTRSWPSHHHPPSLPCWSWHRSAGDPRLVPARLSTLPPSHLYQPAPPSRRLRAELYLVLEGINPS